MRPQDVVHTFPYGFVMYRMPFILSLYMVTPMRDSYRHLSVVTYGHVGGTWLILSPHVGYSFPTFGG